MTTFAELKVTTPEHAFELEKIMSLPALRNLARQLMITNAADEILFNQEYPTYPGQEGLYTGNPSWYHAAQSIFRDLIAQSKEPAALYFSGFGCEYRNICEGVEALTKSGEIAAMPQTHFVKLDVDVYRSAVNLTVSDHILTELDDMFDDFAEKPAAQPVEQPKTVFDEMAELNEPEPEPMSFLSIAMPPGIDLGSPPTTPAEPEVAEFEAEELEATESETTETDKSKKKPDEDLSFEDIMGIPEE